MPSPVGSTPWTPYRGRAATFAYVFISWLPLPSYAFRISGLSICLLNLISGTSRIVECCGFLSLSLLSDGFVGASVAEIVAATSIARPRADVTYCIHALARRLAKTRNWIEKHECFRVLKCDIEAKRLSKQGQGPEKAEGAANNNYLVQYALAQVLKESFKIYCAINDGIINLVDNFFEMPKHEALKALHIYRRAGQQAGNLSGFYESCRGLDLARNFQFPTLRESMTRYSDLIYLIFSHPPCMMPVIEPLELPERLILTYKPAAAAAEEEEEEVREHVPIVEEKRQVVEEPAPVPSSQIASPPKPNIADTGDLLVSDSTPTVSAIEESSALALAILPTGVDNSTATTQQNRGFDPTGWELALVTTSSNMTPLSMESNLNEQNIFLVVLLEGGGFRVNRASDIWAVAHWQ
ncbi:unnamed protein product [Miscanthus lutarioriparius]|uniref:AP180 N-terminal homology (ANTH) domain-containing protein n=1 Tax=Miscanthus lutarioriparius TaxID=422564 RepID=A0A811RI81_9POAL|nr:unnamed protein product [Miscanthus lutarioriparius]